MQEHVQNVYGDARFLRLRSGQAQGGHDRIGAISPNNYSPRTNETAFSRSSCWRLCTSA